MLYNVELIFDIELVDIIPQMLHHSQMQEKLKALKSAEVI